MASGTTREWGRPAEGPWWRFVPRNTFVGYLGAFAGTLLLIQCVVRLSDGGNSPFVTVLEVVVGVLAVALIFRSVDGLRVLHRRRRHRL